MKSFTLAIALLLSISAYGQLTLASFHLGYNANITQPDGLNFIVDRYNGTRSYLTENMKQFSFLDGFTGGIGLHYMDDININVEAGFIGRSQQRSAVGTVNNESQQRDLKVRNHSYYLGVAYDLTPDAFSFIYLGVRGEYARILAITRAGSTEIIGDTDWENIYTGADIYVTPYVKLWFEPFAIEPYFSIPVSQNGIEAINEAINPNTFQNDETPILFGGGGFGVRILFDLSL